MIETSVGHVPSCSSGRDDILHPPGRFRVGSSHGGVGELSLHKVSASVIEYEPNTPTASVTIRIATDGGRRGVIESSMRKSGRSSCGATGERAASGLFRRCRFDRGARLGRRSERVAGSRGSRFRGRRVHGADQGALLESILAEDNDGGADLEAGKGLDVVRILETGGQLLLYRGSFTTVNTYAPAFIKTARFGIRDGVPACLRDNPDVSTVRREIGRMSLRTRRT